MQTFSGMFAIKIGQIKVHNETDSRLKIFNRFYFLFFLYYIISTMNDFSILIDTFFKILKYLIWNKSLLFLVTPQQMLRSSPHISHMLTHFHLLNASDARCGEILWWGGWQADHSVRVGALSRPEPGLLTGPETEQTGVMLDTGQVTHRHTNSTIPYH